MLPRPTTGSELPRPGAAVLRSSPPLSPRSISIPFLAPTVSTTRFLRHLVTSHHFWGLSATIPQGPEALLVPFSEGSTSWPFGLRMLRYVEHLLNGSYHCLIPGISWQSLLRRSKLPSINPGSSRHPNLHCGSRTEHAAAGLVAGL